MKLQISILKKILKDHVTPKTGIMSTEKNAKTENSPQKGGKKTIIIQTVCYSVYN